jgi:hypothetical protein
MGDGVRDRDRVKMLMEEDRQEMVRQMDRWKRT